MRILCVSGCHIVIFLVSTCVFQTSCFRAVNCVIVISCDLISNKGLLLLLLLLFKPSKNEGRKKIIIIIIILIIIT